MSRGEGVSGIPLQFTHFEVLLCLVPLIDNAKWVIPKPRIFFAKFDGVLSVPYKPWLQLSLVGNILAIVPVP